MEFPKLILKGTPRGKSSLKPSKKVWQIKTKVDNSSKQIILITESGELGGRTITRKKTISNIKFSSKKGISTLEKYAEEEAKKLFNRKKKEGYVELADSNYIKEETNYDDKDKENVNTKKKKGKNK